MKITRYYNPTGFGDNIHYLEFHDNEHKYYVYHDGEREIAVNPYPSKWPKKDADRLVKRKIWTKEESYE